MEKWNTAVGFLHKFSLYACRNISKLPSVMWSTIASFIATDKLRYLLRIIRKWNAAHAFVFPFAVLSPFYVAMSIYSAWSSLVYLLLTDEICVARVWVTSPRIVFGS